MTPFLFVLGRTPELAREELRAMFPSSTLDFFPGPIVLMRPQGDFFPNRVITLLGGTVKIARVLTTSDSVEASGLAQLILRHAESSRIVFGISWYAEGVSSARTLASRVKSELSLIGVSARFIAPGSDGILSSVAVEKHRLFELIITSDEKRYLIAHTIAVQPFEEWNARDYARPHADPRAGMLPPKVARMVVNISIKSSEAFHGKPFNSDSSKGVLLDPFCGMGTIISEALLCGYQCIGSDQSESAVERARENIAWLCQRYKDIQNDQVKFFVSDAVHISEKVEKSSIDTIVTEPFMGKSEVRSKVIQNILKGLEKLYIGCLKDWYVVVKPGGTVVMALPEYAIDGKTYFVKKVIDRCETLGYTKLLGPIEYSRPQAIVRRQFFVLTKN